MKAKVLIANRGEIAIRIMKACRDLDLDFVVVYTEADKDSGHVRNTITSGPEKNAWRIASYTDANELFSVADYTECTAIHPGYGFLSEDFRFARRAATRDRPITFIGPDWKIIRDLGDKINVKKVAKSLGIPTVPGTYGPIYNEMEAEELAAQLFKEQQEAEIGTPSILVKATAGGGGMGIEEVTEIAQFQRIYRQLQSYAKRQFGDGGLLLEHCMRDCNHLEVQLVCSVYGERIHFSSRNSTIQSTRRQNRIEAAPGFNRSCCSYRFDEKKVLNQIVEYSIKLAEYVRYDNIGTWEWLVSRSGQPYLVEVTPRIQVGNDVSARISYIDGWQPDLLREQIRLALGERIGYKQNAVKFRGAAIELRIIAEDSRRDFTPWIGTITKLKFPDHPWAALYTHIPIDRPYPIPSNFDPNLALAVVWGDSIDDAKTKAVRFIDETVIEGVDSNNSPIITNLDFLKDNLHRLLAF